jgi:hypothetical protein
MDYWFEERYEDALFGGGRTSGYSDGREEKDFSPRLPDEESFMLGYEVGYQEGVTSWKGMQ